MSDRQFTEPSSIAEAKARKRALERDIMNIERQLAEPVRYDRDGSEMSKKDYRLWRSSAHSSMIFKKAEQAYLKDWIKERRRRVDAENANIFDANDPRNLLVEARTAIKKALAGDDADLGRIFNVIDQYLQHAA